MTTSDTLTLFTWRAAGDWSCSWWYFWLADCLVTNATMTSSPHTPCISALTDNLSLSAVFSGNKQHFPLCFRMLNQVGTSTGIGHQRRDVGFHRRYMLRNLFRVSGQKQKVAGSWNTWIPNPFTLLFSFEWEYSQSYISLASTSSLKALINLSTCHITPLKCRVSVLLASYPSSQAQTGPMGVRSYS